MSAIRVRELTFAYEAGPPVLDGVSLEIAEGEAAVLLGPNGSGKSTLLSLILGYATPRAGEVEIFEAPLSSYTRAELGRTTAYVSAETHLPFNYPVLDYLLLGRAARMPSFSLPGAEDERAARAAAAGAEVAHLLERNVQELSSGELQLVSIARALAQNPRILLLDEPTSHLDPAHARDVFRLMRSLAGEGLTVLFTTHDPLHAREVADTAVLLSGRGVLAAGPAAQTLSTENLGRLYGVTFSEARAGERRVPFVEL